MPFQPAPVSTLPVAPSPAPTTPDRHGDDEEVEVEESIPLDASLYPRDGAMSLLSRAARASLCASLKRHGICGVLQEGDTADYAVQYLMVLPP